VNSLRKTAAFAAAHSLIQHKDLSHEVNFLRKTAFAAALLIQYKDLFCEVDFLRKAAFAAQHSIQH